MKYVFKLVLFALLFHSCSNGSKAIENIEIRNCDCPVAELVDQKIDVDSSIVYNEDDLLDWRVGGKISGKIKKILDAELDADLSYNGDSYQLSTRKVVEKINNTYPQLGDQTYALKLGRLFFCSYYSILCRDSSITDKELREKSLMKLEEFKEEFISLELIGSNETIAQSSNLDREAGRSSTGGGRSGKTEVKINDTSIIVEDMPTNINFGDNSVVGNNINSTITINPQLRFSDEEKMEAVKIINLDLRSMNLRQNNCLCIVANGHNYAKSYELATDLQAFLREQGYNIMECSLNMMNVGRLEGEVVPYMMSGNCRIIVVTSLRRNG